MSDLAMNDNAHPPRGGDANDLGLSQVILAQMENILSIENVAETFGIHWLLLRYCEFRGLIKRNKRIGGAWVYSWADCDRIAFIVKCRKAGLRLSQIAAVILAADDESARVHETGQEYCLSLIQSLEARRKTIDDALVELNSAQALLGAKMCGEADPARRG